MPTQETSLAKLTTVAVFPRYYFLENLAVRHDGSILVTAALQKELWYIPPADAAVRSGPVLVHTFDQLASGIVETQPDVFHISTSDGYTTHESFLHRLDLRHWNPGEPVSAETVLKFGEPAGGLNGSCLLAPWVIALADSVAGLIWRVDLPAGDGTATARVWLTHDTMADDFCLDEDAGVAYLTTHRQNTIDRVPLQPDGGGARQVVAGEPFDEQLVGPSSAAWGRRPGDYGRVAYVTTDGGLIAPPTDDIVRPAKLLRVDLPAADAAGHDQRD